MDEVDAYHTIFFPDHVLDVVQVDYLVAHPQQPTHGHLLPPKSRAGTPRRITPAHWAPTYLLRSGGTGRPRRPQPLRRYRGPRQDARCRRRPRGRPEVIRP